MDIAEQKGLYTSVGRSASRRWMGAACLFLAAAGATGCAGSSEHMAEVSSAASIPRAPDRATVVFVRPSGIGFAINFAILDQAGNWLGDAVAKSHFAIGLPPGEYMFVGWAENTAALKATIAPGRVYYVKVSPKMGFASSGITMEAITPRHPDWEERSTWLAETTRLTPLPSGAAYIQGRRQDAVERVSSALENWSDYSDEDKELRMLRPEDGN